MNTPLDKLDKLVIKEVTIDGIPRLVYMPSNDAIDPKEAIPADIFPILEEIYEGCSPRFLENLWVFLWSRKIRCADDFENPQAMQLVSQAIKLAIKHDNLSILQKVKEYQNGLRSK
jgi:hypothetical protein